MEIFIGFRAYHVKLSAEHIKGRISHVIVEDKEEFICHGGQVAFDARPRFSAAVTGFAPLLIALLLGLLIDVAEGWQQEVKLRLRHAG